MMRRMMRSRVKWAAMALGGSLVLSGCDPTVRDTVLGGVQMASSGLVTSLIAAFFESLAADAADDASQIVMSAIEMLPLA